jgi:hypothetical protein
LACLLCCSALHIVAACSAVRIGAACSAVRIGAACSALLAVLCAYFLSQRLPLRYTQDDMEIARLRICLSILRGQVLG